MNRVGQRSTRSLAVDVLTGLLVVVATGLYVVWRTVEDLAPASDATGAAGSLWRLLLLSLTSAAVATALVEFAKRLLPLRYVFNKWAVQRWLPDFVHSDRQLYYGASLDEVSAQLVSAFHEALNEAQLEGSERSAEFGRWLASRGIRARAYADPKGVELATGRFEADLDKFQIRVSSQWVTLLRTTAAFTAAFLAGVAAAATERDASVVVGVFLGGLTIGGPLSWTIRDLVRVLEAKARY